MPKISPHSAKAKGRRFQQDTLAEIKRIFGRRIKDDHIWSAPMGTDGEDLPMVSEAREALVGYSFECKAWGEATRSKIYSAIRQAILNANGNKYVIVFKQDREEAHVVIKRVEFLYMLRAISDIRKMLGKLNEIEKSTDDESLKTLIQEIKEQLK